jgi:hypothetical protein
MSNLSESVDESYVLSTLEELIEDFAFLKILMDV